MRQKMQTVAVVGGLLLGKLLALGRDVLFTGIFGTEDSAIAYELVGRVPTLLYELTFGGVIFGLLLPVLGRRTGVRAGEGMRLTAGFLLATTPVLLVLSAVGWMLAPQLVDAMTHGWNGAALSLAVQLLRALMFTLPLLTLVAVFTAYLQAVGKLALPTLLSVMPAALTVGYLFVLGERSDIVRFSQLFSLGCVLQTLVLALVTLHTWRKIPFDATEQIRFHKSQLKRFCLLTLPVLLASWVPPIGSMATLLALGRFAAPRAVAYYGYATRLSISVTAMFAFCIGSLFFPRLLASGTPLERERCISRTLLCLTAIVLPVVVGGVLIAEPGIDLLYGRGSFDAVDVSETARLLRFALLSVLPAVATELLLKIHYANGSYGRPLGGALVGMAIQLILLVPLTIWLGGVGVLLSVLVAGVVRALLGVLSLHGREMLVQTTDLPLYGGVLAATGGMLLVVGACHRLHVFVQILLGGLTYLVVLFLCVMLQKKQHVSKKFHPFMRF